MLNEKPSRIRSSMGNGHIEGVKDHDSNRNRHSPLGEFLRVDEKK